MITDVADSILVSPPEITKRPKNIFEQFPRKPEGISALEGGGWTYTDDEHVPGMASLLRWVQRGSGKTPRPLIVDQSSSFFLRRNATQHSVTQKLQYVIQLGDVVFLSPRNGTQSAIIRGPRGRPGLDAIEAPFLSRRGPRGRSGRVVLLDDAPPVTTRGRAGPQGSPGQRGQRGRVIYEESNPQLRGPRGQPGKQGRAVLSCPWEFSYFKRISKTFREQYLLPQVTEVILGRRGKPGEQGPPGVTGRPRVVNEPWEFNFFRRAIHNSREYALLPEVTEITLGR